MVTRLAEYRDLCPFAVYIQLIGSVPQTVLEANLT